MNKVLELEEVSRTFSSGVFRTHTVRAVDRVTVWRLSYSMNNTNPT